MDGLINYTKAEQADIFTSLIILFGIGFFLLGVLRWYKKTGESFYKMIPMIGVSSNWFIYYSFYIVSILFFNISDRFFIQWQSILFICSIYLAGLIVWDLATGLFSFRLMDWIAEHWKWLHVDK